jgi:ribosomal protein S18 acetylase RimI-like enzyme
MPTAPQIPAVIRDFRAEDQATCQALYLDGLIGGRIADNDTGYDIDDIASAYMRSPGNHFWVAQTPDGLIVGMIGVQHYEDGVGEVRRLRVHPQHRRRGIGKALVETAVRFCQEQNYLKVTLDTFMEREPAIRLFEKFRFRHYRTREFSGKELVYFYLDLYAGNIKQVEGPGK